MPHGGGFADIKRLGMTICWPGQRNDSQYLFLFIIPISEKYIYIYMMDGWMILLALG